MLDLSREDLAPLLGLKPGSLKNIELDQKRAVVSSRLVWRVVNTIAALRAQSDLPALKDQPLPTFGDFVSGDETPDNPPSKEQDQETNTGPGRDGGSGTSPGRTGGKTAPKRVKGEAAA